MSTANRSAGPIQPHEYFAGAVDRLTGSGDITATGEYLTLNEKLALSGELAVITLLRGYADGSGPTDTERRRMRARILRAFGSQAVTGRIHGELAGGSYGGRPGRPPRRRHSR